MPPQIRAILGTFISIAGGFAAMRFLFAYILPFQPPAGVGPESGSAYNNWAQALPTEAHYWILGIFLLAAFVGGLIAGAFMLSTRYTSVGPLLSGFILLILGIGQFLAYNHPAWLTYAVCIGMVVTAWLGGQLVVRGMTLLRK
jgi:hypothetical protein